MYTTGDKLLNVMKEEEIGISELARISGVPERTILDIMAGVKEPELGVMCKIAEGLGITEPVSSPTFTIVQVYEEGRMPFYHFDVYRIGDIEEMDEIGYEDYFYGDGLCMIEWANLIEEILPERRSEVTIEKDLEMGFDYRRITIREHQEDRK